MTEHQKPAAAGAAKVSCRSVLHGYKVWQSRPRHIKWHCLVVASRFIVLLYRPMIGI